jgi:hypothetical protein
MKVLPLARHARTLPFLPSNQLSGASTQYKTNFKTVEQGMSPFMNQCVVVNVGVSGIENRPLGPLRA